MTEICHREGMQNIAVSDYCMQELYTDIFLYKVAIHEELPSILETFVLIEIFEQ